MTKTIRQRVEAIMEAAVGRDLSSKERNEFLPSIIGYQRPLSAKQETWLLSIEARLGLVAGEDEISDDDEEDEATLQSTDSFNGAPF